MASKKGRGSRCKKAGRCSLKCKRNSKGQFVRKSSRVNGPKGCKSRRSKRSRK